MSALDKSTALAYNIESGFYHTVSIARWSMARTTLRTIAEAVGVTTSTVSRVLSQDATCYVCQEKKDAILACARRLDYSPNPSAKNLALGKTFNVAFALDNYFRLERTGPFLFQSIKGLQAELEGAGYALSLITLDTQDWRAMEALCASSHKYDGVVFGCGYITEGNMDLVTGSGMPVALLEDDASFLGDIPRTVVNKAGGIAKLLAHLADLGHRRIALYGCGSQVELFKQVFQAEGWKDAGVVFEFVMDDIYNLSLLAYLSADSLLSQLERFTALCCTNDLIALGLCKRLEKEGVVIGRHVSVTGFDDLSMILNVSSDDDFLTTVRNPRFEMGRETAKLLLERIDSGGNRISRKVLPCEIVVRRSTGPACQGQ